MRGHLFERIAGTALAVLLALPAVGAPEVVTLGGETGADPVADCGLLASSPYETNRVGTGLADPQLFLNGATAACEAALAADPQNASVQTWLGRVYLLSGRRDEAQPLLESATASGNAFATYLLSRILGGQLDGNYGEDVDRSAQLLADAADGGYPPAQSDLADRAIAEGNTDEALRLFEAASAGGVGYASYRLGEAYHDGSVIAQDADAAIRQYELALQQGEPLGNYGLGRVYDFGLADIAQDYPTAARFYELAAAKGEKMSQTALAYLYEQGLGVPQDFNRSFALLVDAAAQNWGFAQAALSIHYLFGQGTEVDLTKAFELSWSAQRAGIVYANGIVGYLYQNGLGVTRDLRNALSSYQTGADNGDQYSADQLPLVEIELRCMELAGAPEEPGVWPGVSLNDMDVAAAGEACEAAVSANPVVGNQVWLARVNIARGEYDSAAPRLEDGVAAENPLARLLLADMLLAGQGVAPDAARAISLYEAAADVFVSAQYALGTIYATGNGVPADPAKALNWFRRAAESGSEEAAAQIAALTTIPDPNAIDLSGFGREGPGY